MTANLRERARQIINKIIYVTIATASADGQPWNTPVYSAYDDEYNFYWASDKNGQHSQNIQVNPKVFLVIYDSTAPEGTGEGVYVQANAYQLQKQNEIDRAVGHLYARKNQEPKGADEFLGDYPRRVYKAVPQEFWMNGEGDVKGNFIDIRTEVSLKRQ